MVAGPYVNDEHLVVTVVEADKAEKVHQFLSDARLNQWNTVRAVPYITEWASPGAPERHLRPRRG
jgi:hypothetical protein